MFRSLLVFCTRGDNAENFLASFPETKIYTHTRVLGKLRALYLTCGSTPLVLFISSTGSETSEPHGDPLAPVCHISADIRGARGKNRKRGRLRRARPRDSRSRRVWNGYAYTLRAERPRFLCGCFPPLWRRFSVCGAVLLVDCSRSILEAMCGNGMVFGSPPCATSMILQRSLR